MNAVGIDVSKGKSMMAALRLMGEVVLKPRKYTHDEVGLERMALDILALGEVTRVVMEATGRYHEPVAAALHEYGMGHITTLPKNSHTRLLITTAARELASAKATLAVMRTEMDRLAQQLPEYETVRAMCGVGEKTALQLMAEIGDVRRFPRRSSIVSFAGVDPAVDEFGKHISESNPTTKRGSPHLRKTLYQIVCTYLRKAPADEPVYQFLDKNGPRASRILST